MHALGIDDAYTVDRVLASGPGGVTELVSLDGSVPFIRKRIPAKLARRGVWATLPECGCARLPHVAVTYEMPDEFVVVCDFVPGQNLEQLVAERGRLPEKDAFRLVSQLCEAVSALHAHGIIHRDISPANVIVAADGVHLIDLGIARFRNEGVTHDTTQLGTRGFASPEQCGYAQTDARSDVYSLGRVLGYLLTGVLPETPDTAEYERALADDDVVSPGARQIVQRASALEPSRRYQSAAALAAALGGEKDAAPAASAVAPPTFEPSSRRSGWVKVLLAVMAAVAFVAAVAIILVQALGQDAGEKGSPAAAAPADEPAASAPAADDEPEPDDDAATAPAPSDATADLEIVESGWSADSQGYVHYAVGLRNNGDVTVVTPGFTITGRDASGRVVFSDEQILSILEPGATAYWGFQAGNGAEPATVDFAPIEPQGYQLEAGAEASRFSVSGTNVVPDGIGGTNFTGDVTTEFAGDQVLGGGQVAIVVVLRDETGAIVGGDASFVSAPAEGEPASFEVHMYDVPDYASYDVYALEW